MFNVEDCFRDISRGDAECYDFCRSYLDFVHCLDDLIDKDKPTDVQAVCHTFLKLIYCLSDNTFFQRHKVALLNVIHSSTVAYIDSEKLRLSEDPVKRVAAEVLKSEYQNVFYRAAYCAGGFSHELLMSSKYRDYDFG